MKLSKRRKDNTIFSIKQKMITKIIDTQNKETMKAIEDYCLANNIIPNLIDKDKLNLVLKLGIQALNERELNNER